MGTWVTRLDADVGDGPRLAVKDCMDVAGVPTGAGCPAVAEMAEPAENDAAVVASARAAGARIVGKTALTELCWSANGVNHWQGTPVNPRDPRRVPGGSSSGSAVAVATGEADIGFGTDTGGSVRVPACCCGVAGLRTTWGRVSVKGVYPLAPSLDTVGPLGADLAAVEAGMRLIEPKFRVPAWDPALPVGRLGVIGAEVEPAIDAAVDDTLAAAGAPVTHVACCDFRAALYAAGVIIDAEGFRSNAYLMPYLDQLSPHIRRNMERGARLRGADVDAARQVMDEVTEALQAMLADYPVLVLPVLAEQPPLLKAHGFPMTMLTVPASLAGLSALSLSIPGGVIAGVQVIGADEERVMAFGKMIEAAQAAA